ncbi:phosphotransferase [Hyphomonas sp. FCG-A18]|uniref:aminoglycoside phosphotransferase family protein n=1 Tax=Hyphomonas sp. FCG-A18 TaxID=3080019 RepID=UPI002B2B6238|nr:phosphotransferase [Hyphomonas sp. FCG-A18]
MASDDSRKLLIRDFLTKAGWGEAHQNWLGQDASTRYYARLTRGDETAILMDAPPVESGICLPGMSEAERAATGWNALSRLAASRVDAFVVIAGHLRSLGLRPPHILAHDSASGLALLEDFGLEREFARLIERNEADEVDLYTKAAADLAHLHTTPVPETLHHAGEHWHILPFDTVALKANSDLYADWLHQYDPRARMSDADRARWESARDALIEQAESFPREFTLRDYHAENLLWLPEGRIGLLDFQDAVLGWDAWDMAMLTQDARRAVSEVATEAAISSYLERSGKTESSFLERISVIGTLNALRITGIFARLVKRDGKPRYNDFMPRQQLMLARNLRHPAAADMRAFIAETAPFILEADS